MGYHQPFAAFFVMVFHAIVVVVLFVAIACFFVSQFFQIAVFVIGVCVIVSCVALVNYARLSCLLDAVEQMMKLDLVGRILILTNFP